jgi:anionic cell wall polymer biosynthesis LytR-Cps2A-Psr (LCP) family protein
MISYEYGLWVRGVMLIVREVKDLMGINIEFYVRTDGNGK